MELNGKEYYLLFTLNALDEMQDRFGGYDKMDQAFDQSNPNMIKDMRWLLTLVINEGLEEGDNPFTEKQVGKMIHLGNLNKIRKAMFDAFSLAVSGGEETEGNGETENKEGEAEAVQEE